MFALWVQVLPEAPLPADTGGFGWALLRSLSALVAVSFLAFVLLRWLGQQTKGSTGSVRAKPLLRELDRLVLEPRRSLHLVQVGKRLWLMASSEGGLQAVSESPREDFTAAQLEGAEQPTPWWAALLGGKPGERFVASVQPVPGASAQEPSDHKAPETSASEEKTD